MVRKLIPIIFQGREARGNLRRFGLDIDKGLLTAEVGSRKLCMEDATEFLNFQDPKMQSEGLLLSLQFFTANRFPI